MKNKLLFICSILVFSCFVSNTRVAAEVSQSYLINTLEILAKSALRAYNFDDYIKFTEYFSKDLKQTVTKEYYNEFYVGFYKDMFGDIEFKKLWHEKTVIDPNRPVLVYKAIFQNYQDCLITINFVKEYNNYRITRIQFDKVYF